MCLFFLLTYRFNVKRKFDLVSFGNYALFICINEQNKTEIFRWHCFARFLLLFFLPVHFLKTSPAINYYHIKGNINNLFGHIQNYAGIQYNTRVCALSLSFLCQFNCCEQQGWRIVVYTHIQQRCDIVCSLSLRKTQIIISIYVCRLNTIRMPTSS